MYQQSQYRKTRNRTKIHKRKRRQSFIVSALFILFAIFAALTGKLDLLFHPESKQTVTEYVNQAPEGTDLSVTFLDVGQGNCVLVESDGKYMLIDGGDGSHSSFVVSYMEKHNIPEFEYVIISHYDSDHLSGVIGVLYNYSVGTLFAPDYTADTKIYNSYLNCIEKQNITPVAPKVSDVYTLGNASFEIVCPDRYNYDGDNNNSIGIHLYDDNHSFLILGDAEKESETAMLKSGIDLSADVYMVSHHGSNGASSKDFLKAVNPSFAVISVGADNKYGHPNEKVLNRLQDVNATIFRTDQSGTITAYSTKDSIEWSLEK